MRTDRMRESQNVEDRRGMSGKVMAGGGLGIGGIIFVLIYALMGGNPQKLLNQLGSGGATSSGLPGTGGGAGAPANDASKKFTALVLGDTEDVWRSLFQQMGKDYQEPTLVLFSGSTDSACGLGEAAMGPFYCPGDSKVYIDLSFNEELASRFGAPGDFAQAYVIAHEVGHHVQNLLGISAQVHRAQQGMSEAEANRLSVQLELQADFFAGVWAHHAQQARQVLEAGDVEEALRCASAIGDDTLQKRGRGVVVPESFTHGTSAQRVQWFKRGLETGDMRRGDTFGEVK